MNLAKDWETCIPEGGNEQSKGSKRKWHLRAIAVGLVYIYIGSNIFAICGNLTLKLRLKEDQNMLHTSVYRYGYTYMYIYIYTHTHMKTA
jgi:hypothetical protein